MTATDHVVEAAHDDHPSDWVYIKTALWLGVLTGIEVFTYFESVHRMPDWLLRTLLSVLMVVKFAMVAAIFMHLKSDNPIFTKFIIGGLALAYPVYLLFAYSMGWLPGWHWTMKVVLLAVPPMLTGAWLLTDRRGSEPI